MKIFVDLDGVLVDFIGGIHRALGVNYDINNYPYEPGKWDILEDIPGIRHLAQADKKCNTEFWRGLNWMYDGKKIWEIIKSKFSPSDIYLLTTPMPNLGSYRGKMLWINREMPEVKKDHVIVTQAEKSLFVQSIGRTILVDDRDKNIIDFSIKGGTGILLPRPWNSYNAIFNAKRGVGLAAWLSDELEKL